jgi:hypothetical protein
MEPGITKYRSYIGGRGQDAITGIIADDLGNVIITGYSEADDTSSVNPNFGPQGASDGFIAKIDSTGHLLFHKYFGGSDSDIPYDLCLGEGGSILVVGATESDNIPVTGDAMEPHYKGGNWDAFIMKFSAQGEILYCSYVGGIDDDKAYGIIADSQLGCTIFGVTTSHNYPTVNASQASYAGDQDLFLTRFTPNIGNITFSTFWGSEEEEAILEEGRPIICSNDEIYLTASTESFSFPYSRTPQNVSQDVMVARFNLTGYLLNSIILNTTAQDVDDEYGASLVVNDEGNVYTTGIVYRQEMQLTPGGGDFIRIVDGAVYLTKLERDLSEQTLLVIVDGFQNDTACDIAVNASGYVHITGHTESLNFPTLDSLEEYSGGYDSFLTIANPDNLAIVHSSTTGGVDDESGTYIVFDALNRIVLGGTTNSIDLIPVNAFQDSKADGGYGFDGYLWCFDLSLRTTIVEIEPIQLDFDTSLLTVALAPPIAAVAFLLVISRRMSKKGGVDNEESTPE